MQTIKEVLRSLIGKTIVVLGEYGNISIIDPDEEFPDDIYEVMAVGEDLFIARRTNDDTIIYFVIDKIILFDIK